MKLSWNWGTKLVIAIVLWISFILIMVFRMVQVDVPLVEEDYYPKAVAYQDQIDKRTNAAELSESIRLTQDGQEVKIAFPSEIPFSEISGSIWIYRPAGDREDYHIPIELDSLGSQAFDLSGFAHGKYIFKVDFKDQHRSYYQEVSIDIQ